MYGGLLDEYESDDDHELHIPTMDHVANEALDVMVREFPFKVQESGRIIFAVNQTHDTIYTLRAALDQEQP